jgi:secretion/DNA translocation related TadE-like protein
VLGACQLILTLTLACILYVSATVARHQAQAAADLAALAGARYVVLGADVACAVAEAVVAANRATMTSCRPDGLDLVVSVSVAVRGAPPAVGVATATARAGPVGVPAGEPGPAPGEPGPDPPT